MLNTAEWRLVVDDGAWRNMVDEFEPVGCPVEVVRTLFLLDGIKAPVGWEFGVDEHGWTESMPGCHVWSLSPASRRGGVFLGRTVELDEFGDDVDQRLMRSVVEGALAEFAAQVRSILNGDLS